MSRVLFCGAALAAIGLGHVPSASALTVATGLSAGDLVSELLGSGVTVVGTPTLNGPGAQAGRFAEGTDALPFGRGVVLSTGNAAEIPGANGSSGESVGVLSSGDNDLSTDLAGDGEPDSVALEFDFQFGDGDLGGDLDFGFVFASEDYLDGLGWDFVDRFRLEIDGTNIGLIGGQPVNIDTVNPTSNSDCYVNNVENTDGLSVAGLDFRFDGRSCYLTASAAGLGAGVHSARISIADDFDGLVDSAVFLESASATVNPASAVPLPAAAPLLAAALGGLAALRRRG